MSTEKLFKPFSGYQAVSLAIVLVLMGVISFLNSKVNNYVSPTMIIMGILITLFPYTTLFRSRKSVV